MRRRGTETYSDVELRHLREMLEAAPGVERVDIVERHPRGGYRTTFDLSPDSIDIFIAVLDEHDWMSVM